MLLECLILCAFLHFGAPQSFMRIPGSNVCPTFSDYNDVNSSDKCWYDNDLQLDTLELIEKYVGKAETHRVTTEDGYILTVFRIPRKNPKGVIFLQHSILLGPRSFLTQGYNSTGYDVWIGNQRGYPLSDSHVNMTVNDLKYWDFSLHEIAAYDLPSQLKLVRSKTGNQKVYYYGFSLGGTLALMYPALKPEEAKDNVKVFIAAATGGYFNHCKSTALILPPLQPMLRGMASFFGVGYVLPYRPYMLTMLRQALRRFPWLVPFFQALFLQIFGWTPEELSSIFFNIDAPINLMNISLKAMTHYLQWMAAKNRIQMYDYGPAQNMEVYGSKLPTLYPLQKITAPVYLVSSSDDGLTTMQDNTDLYNDLPEAAKIYGRMDISGINHVDYVFGRNRMERFVGPILKFLETVK